MQKPKGIIRQTVCVIASFLILICWISSVFAQEIPHLIRHKGNIKELLKENEVKKEDTEKDKKEDRERVYTLTFRIYNVETQGMPLWEETHPNVLVKKGEFEVVLGSINNLDLRFDEDYWLGIEIENKGEVKSRERMTSVGYAYMAEDTWKLGGRLSDDYALMGHSHLGEDVVTSVAEAVNADMVDGLHATASNNPLANTLIALDANAKFPLSVIPAFDTANADTVDNFHATATATANYLYPLNGNAKFPASILEGIVADADKLDGKDSTEFSLLGHLHTLMDLTDLSSDLRAAFLAAGAAGASGSNRLAAISDIPLSSGLWTDEGTYIYPNNIGSGFKITDIGDLIVNGKDSHVGIGTTDPQDPLHILASSSEDGDAGAFRVTTPNSEFMLYEDRNTPGWTRLRTTAGNGIILNAAAPSAPLGDYPMLAINASGNVGIGTSNPQFGLDINGATFTDATGSHRMRVYNDMAATETGYICGLSDWSHSGALSYYGPGYDGGSGSELLTGDSVVLSSATNVANGIRIIAANNGTHNAPIIFATGLWYAAAAERMRITSHGYVGIGTSTPRGRLDVNGSIYQRGAALHADYVFEPGYQLESIEEHAEYMWQEKHLRAVPKAVKVEDGQEIVEVGARGKGVLEELEKAHIYIAQLNERVKQLEAKLTEQKVDSR